MIAKPLRYLKEVKNILLENNWSNVWHDTIRGIEWAQEITYLSPGRIAVGYNYLYVMTRILEEKKPQHVLDIGLGISSTLISKYYEQYGKAGAKHYIIEHDPEWVQFYLSNHKLSNFSEVALLERVIRENNRKQYYAYKDFAEKLKGLKFSVISIDAPQGSKHQYARRDILQVLPDILDTSWVILVDDTNRKGEKKTVEDIKSHLKDCGIEYSYGMFRGMTNVSIIASKDNGFLCSL